MRNRGKFGLGKLDSRASLRFGLRDFHSLWLIDHVIPVG